MPEDQYLTKKLKFYFLRPIRLLDPEILKGNIAMSKKTELTPHHSTQNPIHSENKAEAKKEPHPHHSNEMKSEKKQAHEPLPGGCAAWNCKHPAHHLNFCHEHYEHFKFGLIKKTGEPVLDYDKKLEHYALYQSKQKLKVKKVA